MTGAFITVVRNGQSEFLEIEYLTDDERAALFLRSGENNVAEILKWLNLTCDKLKETEKLFNELVADGILEKRDK